MGFKLNLSDKTEETADRDKFPEAGWYRANLTDAGENPEKGHLELEFEINHGPFKGCPVKQSLMNPEYAEDEDKAKKAVDKAAGWAKRMGAVKPEDYGRDDVEPDFVGCIGNEYVLELESRSFKGDDGQTKNFTGPKYLGIFPLDHEKIPEKVRADLKLPPSRKPVDEGKPAGRGRKTAGAAATASAPAGNIDVSNL